MKFHELPDAQNYLLNRMPRHDVSDVSAFRKIAWIFIVFLLLYFSKIFFMNALKVTVFFYLQVFLMRF